VARHSAGAPAVRFNYRVQLSGRGMLFEHCSVAAVVAARIARDLRPLIPAVDAAVHFVQRGELREVAA